MISDLKSSPVTFWDKPKTFPGILCSHTGWDGTCIWTLQPSPRIGIWSVLCNAHMAVLWRRSTRQAQIKKAKFRCLVVSYKSTSDIWASLVDGYQWRQFNALWRRCLMPGQLNCVDQVLHTVTYTFAFKMPYVTCLATQLCKGAHLSYLWCHVY